MRLQDIDIELGEVCTAITKYAMSNKNANVDIEAVDNIELTSSKAIAGASTKMPEPMNIETKNAPSCTKTEKAEEDCDVGYITQLDKDGNIQQVPIKFDGEIEDEPNPLADFMAGKPIFSFFAC